MNKIKFIKCFKDISGNLKNEKILYQIILLYPVLDIIYNLSYKVFEVNMPINQLLRGILTLIMLIYIKDKRKLAVIICFTFILLFGEFYFITNDFYYVNIVKDISYILKLVLFITSLYFFEYILNNSRIKGEVLLQKFCLSTFIININIIISKMLSINVTTSNGARSYYRGLFYGQNTITVVILIMIPIAWFLYTKTKLKIYMVNFIFNIVSAFFIGTKTSFIGALGLGILIGIIELLKYISKYNKIKVILYSTIVIIVTIIALIKPVGVFLNKQAIIMDKNGYKDMYTYLVSNRNYQCKIAEDYIKNNKIEFKTAIIGAGFSNINKELTEKKSQFKIIEMDIFALIFYSGLPIASFIFYQILKTFYMIFRILSKDYKNVYVLALLLSIITGSVHSFFGGHVIFEALATPYFTVLLACVYVYYKKENFCGLTSTISEKNIKENKYGKSVMFNENFMEKKDKPLIYIVLLNYNGLQDTIECIESIKENDYSNYKIVVVDNNSTDNSEEKLRKLYNNECIIIQTGENLGFSGGNNIGIKYSLDNGAEYVLLLNNDTIVKKDFLSVLVETANKMDKPAMYCSKIYYYNNKKTIWYAGGAINEYKGNSIHYGYNKIDNGEYNEIKDVSFATGCCMLIHKDIIKDVGLLSEKYFLYYEDTDYCCQVKMKNYKIIFCPKSILYHKISASTGRSSDLFQYYNFRNRMIFIKEYIPLIKKPCAYLYFGGSVLRKLINGQMSIKPIARGFRDSILKVYGKKY